MTGSECPFKQIRPVYTYEGCLPFKKVCKTTTRSALPPKLVLTLSINLTFYRDLFFTQEQSIITHSLILALYEIKDSAQEQAVRLRTW